jgi:hypothetical protein
MTMSDVQITLTIPEALAERAKKAGILTEAHLLALLEADTQRVAEQPYPADWIPKEGEPIPDHLMFKGDPEFEEAVQRARQLLADLPPIDEVEGIDMDNGAKPTRREVEIAIRETLERNASGNYPMRRFGRHKGQIWMSDNFDDELPDEEWGDLFK